MSYHQQIVDLVTAECAKGTSHNKVLEPLANMVASVLAGIKHEHDVDDRLVFHAQIDKFFDKYLEAYQNKKGAN